MSLNTPPVHAIEESDGQSEASDCKSAVAGSMDDGVDLRREADEVNRSMGLVGRSVGQSVTLKGQQVFIPGQGVP